MLNKDSLPVYGGELRLEVSANDHDLFLPALLPRLFRCWLAGAVSVVVFSWAAF